jgi:hypothetical protein
LATTYSFEFTLQLAALKLTAKKDYGDGLRPAATFSADLGKKLGNLSLKSTTPDNQAGGASLGVGDVYDVPAAGDVTIDMRSVTDLAERATQAFGRYKALVFALLSAAQGGTACAGVTIGNAATNAHQLFLGGDTMTLKLKPGQFLIFGDTGAGGTVVDGTNKAVLVANDDATVIGKLLVGIVGGP